MSAAAKAPNDVAPGADAAAAVPAICTGWSLTRLSRSSASAAARARASAASRLHFNLHRASVSGSISSVLLLKVRELLAMLNELAQVRRTVLQPLLYTLNRLQRVVPVARLLAVLAHLSRVSVRDEAEALRSAAPLRTQHASHAWVR
eukprot:3119854-Prymnesium_polylepis.2